MKKQTMRESSAEPLRHIITHQNEALLRVLQQYVVRFGLAAPPHHTAAASELLNDVAIEALRQKHRLPDDADPFAWLLGIALNLIKRRQSTIAKRHHREPLIQDLYPAVDMNEGEIIDQFVRASARSRYDEVDQRDLVDDLLAGASPEDEQLLRLAMEHHFDGEAIARDLGIRPGAARVRLHRALKRQRQRLGITRNESKS